MRRRPPGVTALAVLLGFGAAVSATAALSLLVPGSVLEPMWRLNPRARASFAVLGGLAPLLLAVVCAACTLAMVGLWRRRRWGYRLTVGMLAVHGIADIGNVVLGIEPRAAIGIPIVLGVLVYLARPAVRGAFDPG